MVDLGLGIAWMMSHVLDVRVIGIVEGIVLLWLAVSRDQCAETGKQAPCQTDHFDEREL